MNTQVNKRIPELDVAKGILIILMVFGHSIQLYNGNDYLDSQSFYDNPIFKVIYSFHMPMFAIISGFLFYSKHDKPASVVLKKLLSSLLIPIIVWSLLFKAYQYTYLAISGTLEFSFIDILHYTIINLWFLWAILFNSVIVLCVQRLGKDSLWGYLLVVLLTFFIPNWETLVLWLFLTPFFIGGYLCKKYNIFAKLPDYEMVIGGGHGRHYFFCTPAVHIFMVLCSACLNGASADGNHSYTMMYCA